MTISRLKIGTRGSRLASAQTVIVVNLISKFFPGLPVDVIRIRTLGDRLSAEKRSTVDGKTAFTGDIESLLLKEEVDIAVHSMKDLPSELHSGLAIGATPPRGDPRDVLVSTHGSELHDLPQNAAVGTSSIRRKAQLMRLRNDLSIIDLHGNVETRLRKMGELGLDAIVLASAGLERIGESRGISQFFSIEEMVPAAGQGILAVEIREDDKEIRGIVSKIDDEKTKVEATCERAFVNRIGGDCYVPVGACAQLSGESLTVVGMIGTSDGSTLLKRTMRSDAVDADSLGRKLAGELLGLGGNKILERVAS
jgi:hydroxymethylbilane synthase